MKMSDESSSSSSLVNELNSSDDDLELLEHYRKRPKETISWFPGSDHDSRILRSSPFLDTLPEKCQSGYILGDSGYPGLRHLMTPYRDRGQLRRVELNYNIKLSQNRYIVEHCVGILKQKFRELYHLKLRKTVDMAHFIRACCVLHNFALDDNFHVEYVEINEVRLPEINKDDNEDRDDAPIQTLSPVLVIKEYICSNVYLFSFLVGYPLSVFWLAAFSIFELLLEEYYL
ncbi:uncharacterized protein CBL_20364 [Carabus blaptoides fortunei]